MNNMTYIDSITIIPLLAFFCSSDIFVIKTLFGDVEPLTAEGRVPVVEAKAEGETMTLCVSMCIFFPD